MRDRELAWVATKLAWISLPKIPKGVRTVHISSVEEEEDNQPKVESFVVEPLHLVLDSSERTFGMGA